MAKRRSKFPSKPWEEMTKEEQEFFYSLSEKELKSRWKTNEGREIRRKIERINLNRGSSKDYSRFLGTLKLYLNKRIKPRFDLRGIDFSGTTNVVNNEFPLTILPWDFSNCSLYYCNFSNSAFLESNFANSDIIQSNFSNSNLIGCNFNRSNLTSSNFSNCNLEGADFRNCWMTSANYENSDLGYIKFNSRTNFQNLDVTSFKGTSNPLFISYVQRKRFLKHFREQNKTSAVIYSIWWLISDCGQNFFRWFIVSMVISGIFGYLFSHFRSSFIIESGRKLTHFTFYYYSIVTFTTLGFGDIVPKDLLGELLVTIEVILGYIMLGGLISILATKFVPRVYR